MPDPRGAPIVNRIGGALSRGFWNTVDRVDSLGAPGGRGVLHSPLRDLGLVEDDRTLRSGEVPNRAMSVEQPDPIAPPGEDATPEEVVAYLRAQGFEVEEPDQELGSGFNDQARGIWMGDHRMGGNYMRPNRDEPYVEGDQRIILQELPEEGLALLQDRLVGIGLIDPTAPGFVRGGVGTATVDAFGFVLGESNGLGMDWRQSLDLMTMNYSRGGAASATGGGPGGDGAEPMGEQGFVAPIRTLEPDRDRLRQDVMGYARDRLGRDLSDEEADALSGVLADIENDSFNRQVAASRSEFDARQAAAGQPGGVRGADGSPSGEEFGDNFIASKFERNFDDRFAGELNLVGRMDAARQLTDGLTQGFNMASRMTGGV